MRWWIKINSQPYQTNSAVYNQVFSLLRSALWGEERFPYQSLQDIDWENVHKELKQQGVQFFPIKLLARENPDLTSKYITADAKNMMRWDRIMKEQQILCFLLRDNGISCAVVKGAAAAVHYPQPSSRPLGDIDILVAPENFESACLLISEGADCLGENFRHKGYRRNGVVVEVHKAFSTIRDLEKRDFFDRRIFGAIDSAESVMTDNYTFFRLPKIEHGLTLLEHIDIHLENGLGLRQIIDWMMFVDREMTDENWYDEFAPFLRQLEREKLAITVTRMCQMFLGLRTDITWCFDADETLCCELMQYIMYQGNFGKKNQKGSNRAAAVIAVGRNPISLLRILQHLGCIKWKATEKYRFLKPFAWLYMLIRYITIGLRTEHPIRFLKNAVKRSKSQNDFLEALGVSKLSEEVQKHK